MSKQFTTVELTTSDLTLELCRSLLDELIAYHNNGLGFTMPISHMEKQKEEKGVICSSKVKFKNNGDVEFLPRFEL